eukprot:g7633.t1
MSKLTENLHRSNSRTVLYIPTYLIPPDADSVLQDKDLLQQIESVTIQWTRKIKEVIYETESLNEAKDNSGPLEELQFWSRRSEDLNGIRCQLQSAPVIKIVSLLEFAKSAYLSPFLELRNSIEREAICADDNLKFLNCLRQPCEKLASASPVEIPSTLPPIVNTIRVIWNLSRFYNTSERISSLLTKLSNEVINRCRAQIRPDRVLCGEVHEVMNALKQSIRAGEKWKAIYKHTALNVQRTNARSWNFDESYIFANIDAFIQRCADLEEICLAQLQFAPKSVMPIFKGLRGPQIKKSLNEIYGTFGVLVGKLGEIGYDMLDVKQTQWLDDFAKFRAGVKDMEIMFNNVLSHAFENATALIEKIEVLGIFSSLAKMHDVKRALVKKTSEFYKTFLEEVNQIKRKFDELRRQAFEDSILPQYSGNAKYTLHFTSKLHKLKNRVGFRSAMCLMRRLDETWSVLAQWKGVLPKVHEYVEAEESYTITHQSIEQFIANQHQEWFASVHTSVAKGDTFFQQTSNCILGLENTILVSEKDTSGKLAVHFDPEILNMLQEVRYWESLGMGGPYIAMEINAQRAKYKILRETALTLVRQYNTIMGSLDENEKRLLRDRIKVLDRKVLPGVSKLRWISDRHTLEFYFKEASRQCQETLTLVQSFKEANENIASQCKHIATTSLVSIEQKRIYSIVEFEEKQKIHLATVRMQFHEASEKIKDAMKLIYTFFKKDSNEVQLEWTKFTQRIDAKMEASLKSTIKSSLQEISKCFNGEKRKEAVPAFFVMLVLERNNRVELQPTIQSLFDMVHGISRELISTIKTVDRVYVQLSEKHIIEYKTRDLPLPSELPSFYEMISNDEETTLKTIVQITNGITSIVDKVQQFLNYWERKYKSLWDHDKVAYLRRYEKAQKPLSSFIADITRHLDLQEEVMSEDALTNMKFLRIECAPLKQALISHCAGWVQQFTTLLHNNAKNELECLENYFESNKQAMQLEPKNLDELGERVKLHRKLQEEKYSIEARIEPIRGKYSALERFEVSISDEEHSSLDMLEPSWNAFLEIMESTQENLESSKDVFREKVKSMVEQFKMNVKLDLEEFKKLAPYDADNLTTDVALEFIESSEHQLQLSRNKAKELKEGMEIFGIMPSTYPELDEKSKELEKLRTIWETCKQWEELYTSWKDGLFRELQVDSMEVAADTIGKSLIKQGREIGQWPIWNSIKKTVDGFRQTMPLISDLRNPALRQRHWEALIDEIGQSIDPNSDDFTLDSVINLRLDLQIDEIWNGLEFQMSVYKKTTFKLKSTEEVFSALEDSLITISTIKASKLASVFHNQIKFWESTLSNISETTELILQVQRSWMYLENIFIDSEDIQRQLPAKHELFQSVHGYFTETMEWLAATRIIKQCCQSNKLCESLYEMVEKLERVERSLEDYLEAKRQRFPRFYFVSNEDLLEILGHSKNPDRIQPHLKKCFEGINALDIQSIKGMDGVKYQSIGVRSPDGEYLSFDAPVSLTGSSEDWLNEVESSMFQATKTQLLKSIDSYKNTKREKWVKEHQGQMVITAGQISWTEECEKALTSNPTASNCSKALKLLKKKWIAYLNKLTTMTRSELPELDRNKIVALITIEVHARDVIDQLIRANCSSLSDFQWVSQLRFYWDKDSMECVVKQVLSEFKYGYEYQGNNGRLVITPLTDRCYMTLGAALFTKRGGNPLGPAGTGKTETVKDFGKALARFVVVFNCSDGIDYKMTERILSGLAQSGAWACLDEFNRIEVEVLSVVSTQISLLMQAMKQELNEFEFFDYRIRLVPTCGVFVTMNPGYAGRSNLPDNLKALLRPISMMVPDFTLIAEIMMFSEGFSNAKTLAKKMISIMELSQQQLSQQDHYDYGLRSYVIPIARAAGVLRRCTNETSEDRIVLKTMIDLIKPKLVYSDIPLFTDLLNDLFPGIQLPTEGKEELKLAITEVMKKMNLQIVDNLVSKIIQIFDCKMSRHGNMIVGKTGSGKSTAWRVLQQAITELHLKNPHSTHYSKVNVHVINPLALTNDELYGSFDRGTNEWKDGVISHLMRNVCRQETTEQHWMLFDGPVDPLWIESMNSLLDDNKLLTLISGERISMSPQVSLLFEVEDLSKASPATVSRTGMIYLNVEDLGWRPFLDSWINSKSKDQSKFSETLQTIKRLIDKHLQSFLNFKTEHCEEMVHCDALSCVRTFTNYFDSFVNFESVSNSNESELVFRRLELWFIFCATWSIGGNLNAQSRTKFDEFVRDLDPQIPLVDSIFEYFVDEGTTSWIHWDTKLFDSYKPPKLPFFRILVPTVDTIRNKFLISSMVESHQNILLVGGSGSGKTTSVLSILSELPDDTLNLTLTFSSQTSSNSLQDSLESKLEKRGRGVFGPIGHKRLVCFVDDMNMPKKSTFGFMPPLELMKLWNDHGFWFDRRRCEVKKIQDLQLIGAMGPPGGGRNTFSERIQSCFSILSTTDPNDKELQRIYSTLLNTGLTKFEYEVRSLGDKIVRASIELYRIVCKELLPTPMKSHYLFNTRDLSRVIQGVLRAKAEYYDTKEHILQLWIHETQRVFSDRMWDAKDKQWLQENSALILKSTFDVNWMELFPHGVPPFASFFCDVEDPPYETIANRCLEDFGLECGNVPMDLVLFNDALHHLCRIHRIITQSRGNALLIGVGGSGKKSLTKLAAYIAEFNLYTIEITKNYRQTEFNEDLKELYRITGVQNKPTVFLLDDSQIQQETFLESVNNMLTSGEVPGLFDKDELQTIFEELQKLTKEVGEGSNSDKVFNFFLERVKLNLRVVICMSPIGEEFRRRCQLFPGLLSCTSLDWFTDWPNEALYEVATKQFSEDNIICSESLDPICKFFAIVHQSVSDMSNRMELETKRRNYVTPMNYLETVRGYKSLMKEKRQKLNANLHKLTGGLQKLNETSKQVSEMQTICKQKKINVAQAKLDCEELLVKIVQDKRVADEQEKQVNAKADKISKETIEADKIAKQVQTELDRALPALQAAEEALNVLTKRDMSELKAYANPPALVELTLGAVMTVLSRPATWDESKKALGDPSFMEKLIHFDKANLIPNHNLFHYSSSLQDKLTDSLLKRVRKFTNNPEFIPETIGSVSAAARGEPNWNNLARIVPLGLCLWVRAMEVYGNVAKEVAPKREQLHQAQMNLKKKQHDLEEAQNQLSEVLDKVKTLRENYEESTSKKKALEDELEILETKLDRAHKLVTGLAGERARWEESISELEERIGNLVGDIAIATSFMSYCGPFPSKYRLELVHKIWIPQIQKLDISATNGFDFACFMANSSDVRDWNLHGLPTDDFSTENGVMITRSCRWPLLIDPQRQGNEWIRNTEKTNKLIVLNLNMADMTKQLESAIQFGNPVLLEDIKEELDPILDPILSKSFIKKGSRFVVKLGDKEVDVNFDFKLYITTKLPMPHYAPEISTKVMIVNFTVTLEGLQAQLLNTIVQHERSDLYQQKNDLVVKVANGKITQLELEDKILELLSSTSGSLLDDIELIDALDQSKATYQEVNEALNVAQTTSIKIDSASREYEPCASRAAILFFILSGLSSIDPMYQFSLEAYKALFDLSLNQSPKRDNVIQRVEALNEYHTYAFYKYATRGLFERHKLLLSLQMAFEISKNEGIVTSADLQMLLRKTTQSNRASRVPNPAPKWISHFAWEEIQDLESHEDFEGIMESITIHLEPWKKWICAQQCEVESLPIQWSEAENPITKMILIKPDRVVFSMTNFIKEKIGVKFAEPLVLDLHESFLDSDSLTPLIFVLSPGIDPTENLKKLAKEMDMEHRLFIVALGQGQAQLAMRLIEDGIHQGHWIFLANCHLMISWLPSLEALVKNLETMNPHKDFRLWLSCNPCNLFPMSILQRAIKMTTEPPKGLRSNLMRLYQSMDCERSMIKKQMEYEKLKFALAYFHSVLLERRKFRFLGLNIPYDFNDTDFQVSNELLKTYLVSYEPIPWDALRYLIAEANYGGRVIDERDRRVLNSYLTKYYCEEAISHKKYRLSSLEEYYIPPESSVENAMMYIKDLPLIDPPEAFGQHPNAEISFLKEEGHWLLSNLCQLQGQSVTNVKSDGIEDSVRSMAEAFLSDLPHSFNLTNIMAQKSDDPSALHVFLFQEIDRYNSLLQLVRHSCEELIRGIRGLVVMSGELEAIFKAFADARVPETWSKACASHKPLSQWKRDLSDHLLQLEEWIQGTYPIMYWLSGFTYPTGFLIAVLQTYAREKSIPVDELSFEVVIMYQAIDKITTSPPEGVYVKGVFLEGAGWDSKNNCLCEPKLMELYVPMPVMWFRPIENKKKNGRKHYSCPLYSNANRCGTSERLSFMMNVELPSGNVSNDHWILRGTALLLEKPKD